MYPKLSYILQKFCVFYKDISPSKIYNACKFQEN
jgi:hypothetical protein